MRKGFFLKLFLILFILITIISVTFMVDFNLIAAKSSPKFCFKEIEHAKNAKEYIGLGYKIIRYQINDEEQKLKVGSLFLKYDPNFISSFSPKVDIQGYIREIKNNSGVYVVYIESNKSYLKNYNYDKAYATVSNNTKIKDLENNKECKKQDLKVGQLVNLSFVGNVQEIYPVRGTAGTLDIVNNIKNGDDNNE